MSSDSPSDASKRTSQDAWATVVPHAPLESSAESSTASPVTAPTEQNNYESLANDPSGQLATAALQAEQNWPEIPGFDIVRELGRGGMGVVFLARQRSAQRIVALKVVRRDVLEAMPMGTRASTLDRFRSEAQAAANLDHDHLVTVYEVGESAGLCYYAMRYVDGRSLADMLRDGPLDPRRAAGYLEPVARALHEAHRRGILHRDLKPHNILVDQRTDRALLADFGLAKFVERSDDLTHAGELLGTPSYMSPEQATDAAHVTALADVYSLGATFYHLVTGRPPFQSASLTETIRQVVSDDPIPPRRLNAAVDRDVETICLKCLVKESARRYGSAEQLADDLHRYLEGRPIVARPLSWPGRVWRWCRRNPWSTGLIATATLTAVYGFAATVVGYVQTRAALAESERRLERTVHVVDDLFTRVSEDELLNEPGMQPLRKELLDQALEHYQYFLAESRGNPSLREGVADAHFRLGVISQLDTARHAEALSQLSNARQLQAQLLHEAPTNRRRLKALADTLNWLGNLHMLRSEFSDAVTAFTEAGNLRQRLVQSDESNSEYQRLLANVWMNLGSAETNRGALDAAMGHLQRAQELRAKLLEDVPSALKIRRDYAKGFFRIAALELGRKETKAAEAALRQSVTQFERVLADDPRSLASRYDLGAAYRQLGAIRAEAEDTAGAIAMFDAARRPMMSLAIGNPDVSDYQVELAVLAMTRGGLYEDLQKPELALAAWAEALPPLADLLRREPMHPDYRRNQAITRYAMGVILVDLDRPAEARDPLREAREGFAALAKEFPDDQSLQQQLRDVTEELDALPPAATPTPTNKTGDANGL